MRHGIAYVSKGLDNENVKCTKKFVSSAGDGVKL